MGKKEAIKELKQWAEEEFPGQEAAYIAIESIHTSGQQNYAIYSADDNKVIQENDYKNEDEDKRKEKEYLLD